MKHKNMMMSLALAGAMVSPYGMAAQADTEYERYLDVVAEPADGGFFDPAKPGTGITLTKVTANLYYGLYYGYDADGRPMWRNFVGEYVPANMSDGHWKNMGTLSAGTNIASNGQVLGGPYREQDETIAPEGEIKITFHSARSATISYGGTTFNGVFPQVSNAAKINGATFGILDGHGDHVEVRIKTAQKYQRFRNVIVTEPHNETAAGVTQHAIAIGQNHPLFTALCPRPKAAWGGELQGHITFDSVAGVGTIEIAGYDIETQSHTVHAAVAKLVASRDGIVFRGRACEDDSGVTGWPIEGVILPNRSQMVYFDLTDE